VVENPVIDELPAQLDIKPKEIPAKETTKPKTTINLGNILKGQPKEETIKEEKNGVTPRKDAPVSEDTLRKIWTDYTELRKNQMAEYHLLKQPFTFRNNIITLALTNPIEEPVLLSIKTDLLTYLREHLNNSSIQVDATMQEHQIKKFAYTNKEKFEHMAEKYPLLNDLKEKMGLDPDF